MTNYRMPLLGIQEPCGDQAVRAGIGEGEEAVRADFVEPCGERFAAKTRGIHPDATVAIQELNSDNVGKSLRRGTKTPQSFEVKIEISGRRPFVQTDELPIRIEPSP